MNSQDRVEIREVDKKVDGIKDDIHALHLEVKDLFSVVSVEENKIETITDNCDKTKTDYEKRFRLLEKGERKTILIASIVGAIVTGGGALILHLLG